MRRRFIVSILFIFLFKSGVAQEADAIRYANKITGDDMRPYLEVLTADSLQGRETGKRGQKKAASYIAGHFQSLGLKPVSHDTYFQHTSLSARANGGRNFEVNEKFFVFMRDYFYPPGFEDTLMVVDTIIFSGLGISSGSYDDYANINVKDRAVIFFDEALPAKKKSPAINTGVDERIRIAASKGARLAVIVTDSLEKIIDQYTYGAGDASGTSMPFAFVSREMAKSFFPEVNEKMPEKAERKILRKSKPQSFISSSSAQLSFIKNTDAIRGENVLGYLEGTDKAGEVLVLTAHYDHLGVRDSLIYHGADDDGSGTTAVMEMAKIFSEAAREGHRPRRSILFMTVSGEEKGLLGSRYYVKYPVIPLERTIADLNTDMIGRTDEKHDSLKIRDYVYIIGSDKLSTTLHRINEETNAGFTKLELDYTYNKPDDPNRYYYRSDHYNFARHNIPIIFYFNGTHDDYHKPSDTIDKIQFDLLAKRTQLIFLTAWELVNREERIKADAVSDMPDKKEE